MSSRQAFTALSQTRNSEEDTLCAVCILLHYLISPHSATNGITNDLCIPKPILRHQPLCHQSSLTWQLCIIFPFSLSLLSTCRSLSNYPLSLNKLPSLALGLHIGNLGNKSLSLSQRIPFSFSGYLCGYSSSSGYSSPSLCLTCPRYNSSYSHFSRAYLC